MFMGEVRSRERGFPVLLFGGACVAYVTMRQRSFSLLVCVEGQRVQRLCVVCGGEGREAGSASSVADGSSACESRRIRSNVRTTYYFACASVLQRRRPVEAHQRGRSNAHTSTASGTSSTNAVGGEKDGLNTLRDRFELEVRPRLVVRSRSRSPQTNATTTSTMYVCVRERSFSARSRSGATPKAERR